MISEAFEADLARNKLSPVRKLYWVFAFMRLEQNAKQRSQKRFFALLKKVVLRGSCCELPASACVGGGLCLPHLNGIVISPYAKIGANCKILQQVTIGVDQFKDDYQGPVIGSGVFIGAGARVIGPITVGNNVVIGANAVVTKDIPSCSTVVGANRILAR